MSKTLGEVLRASEPPQAMTTMLIEYYSDAYYNIVNCKLYCIVYITKEVFSYRLRNSPGSLSSVNSHTTRKGQAG